MKAVVESGEAGIAALPTPDSMPFPISVQLPQPPLPVGGRLTCRPLPSIRAASSRDLPAGKPS